MSTCFPFQAFHRYREQYYLLPRPCCIHNKQTNILVALLLVPNTISLPPSQGSDMSGCCRSPVERRSSPTGSITSTQSQSQLTPSSQLSDGERLKKVILELVDTEKTYVKVSTTCCSLLLQGCPPSRCVKVSTRFTAVPSK